MLCGALGTRVLSQTQWAGGTIQVEDGFPNEIESDVGLTLFIHAFWGYRHGMLNGKY